MRYHVKYQNVKKNVEPCPPLWKIMEEGCCISEFFASGLNQLFQHYKKKARVSHNNYHIDTLLTPRTNIWITLTDFSPWQKGWMKYNSCFLISLGFLHSHNSWASQYIISVYIFLSVADVMCKKIHTTYYEATFVTNVVDKLINLYMKSLLVINLSKIYVFARYISNIRIK